MLLKYKWGATRKLFCGISIINEICLMYKQLSNANINNEVEIQSNGCNFQFIFGKWLRFGAIAFGGMTW